MSRLNVSEWFTAPSPRLTARAGGFFWLMTFVAGVVSLLLGGRFVVSSDAAATAANILANEPLFRWAVAADLIATVTYIAATLFVYVLLKPVSRNVSLLAAFFSLIGCAGGALGFFLSIAPVAVLQRQQYLSVFTVEQLQAVALTFLRFRLQASHFTFVFFGLHCLLVGYLVLRSTFLPRVIGTLMVLAGLGWLTYSFANLLAPPFGRALSPWIMLPGMVGEGSLSLWLLVAGVNVPGWLAQAGAEQDPSDHQSTNAFKRPVLV